VGRAADRPEGPSTGHPERRADAVPTSDPWAEPPPTDPPMRYIFACLVRNLSAGARLALFRPVARSDFRIDLAQLALLFVLSALLDIAIDYAESAAGSGFDAGGLTAEFVGAGVLLAAATVVALALRRPALALAVPVLALAAYPVLQVVRIALAHASGADAAGWALTVALLGWSAVLIARATLVAASGDGAAPRWPRYAAAVFAAAAIVAGAFVGPAPGWWQAPGDDADAGYGGGPNAASEPVMVAQRELLDDALADLDDERSGTTDLYFVGFGADAADNALAGEIKAAEQALADTYGAEGRTLGLINHPATLLSAPIATVTNLREALSEIGAAIDPGEDVVMIYLAGRGNGEGLSARLPPLELLPLTPSVLDALLDEAGIRWRVIVVDACDAGDWIGALADDETAILAAAACPRAGRPRFGPSLFGEVLPAAGNLADALAHVHGSAGAGAPVPRLSLGRDLKARLEAMSRGRDGRGAGRSV
jgi:hypothetical protein